MSSNNLRVLIVAEHASLEMGGEAALPLHYFRVLRQRGISTWLIVHERTREELQSLFHQDDDRIYFVSDTWGHRLIWQCSKFLPQRLFDFTLGLILRLITQIVLRRIAKKIVQEKQIDIIHQPILVSPREPSMIFKMGVPVVIGPMNGGMKYPPAFRYRENLFVHLSVEIGRHLADLFNILIPGKLQATTLLVANQRTKEALPKGISGKVIEIKENGVDLSIWQPQSQNQNLGLENSAREINTQNSGETTKKAIRFVFIGRLVKWKAVDLLILAFKRVSEQISAELEIIGKGEQLPALKALATEIGLQSAPQNWEDKPQTGGIINFTGFLPQKNCAQRLELADVMVLPSLYECGGATILEAMTMGIPVIATHWGGPVDYLDESCGILIEPKKPDLFINDLANAMLKMAASPKLRFSMGQAGRQLILEHFDWEVKIDTMLEIYREAIDSDSKSSQRSRDGLRIVPKRISNFYRQDKDVSEIVDRSIIYYFII